MEIPGRGIPWRRGWAVLSMVLSGRIYYDQCLHCYSAVYEGNTAIYSISSVEDISVIRPRMDDRKEGYIGETQII